MKWRRYCVWCNERIIVVKTPTKELDPYVFRGGLMLHERCAPKWDREVQEAKAHA